VLEEKEENFQLIQEALAREVEAKRKFFDLKEKELEEKEKELELKQRQVQERSIQDGPSVDAEPLTQQRNHNDEDKEKDSASVLSASVQISEAHEKDIEELLSPQLKMMRIMSQ